MKSKTTFALVLGLACSHFVQADDVTIPANRDAGFFAAGFDMGVPGFVDANLGAHTHVPVGQANSDRVNRSVFDFDILGNVPDCAVINTATFEFEVTLQGGPQGQDSVDFSLHRVVAAWDEGTGESNIGEITGDGVTWVNRTGTELWAVPGGDFAATSSGVVFVNGPATYAISSPQLVADIQAIVDGNVSNFGFLLKADPEGVFGSAARVTSREGGNPAKLIIDFTAVLLGDVNLDGMVNLLDVEPFVSRVTTGTFQAEADINKDGFVNLLDINPFVAVLTGG